MLISSGLKKDIDFCSLLCNMVKKNCLFGSKIRSVFEGLGSTPPGAPLTYFNGGGSGDFFGYKILAQSDFFGSMKDAGFFLGCEKKNRGSFLGCEKRTKEFFCVC